ncbi:MAG: TrkH family potassium uptake protein [Deltaproteobacteria bacterium]|nr:TrkH family potassium uptake protein [Deltaproteobacteria bacterium]
MLQQQPDPSWTAETFKRFAAYLSRSVLKSPARIAIFGFGAVILTGALLLMLPAASTATPIGFVNALFTATSATCVTGLVVLDTGRELTRFGQVVILAMIQVGGLGIMTISTLLLMVAGKRPSMIGRVVISDTLTHSGDRSVGSLLKDVALFTLVIESLGALVMFIQFLPGRTKGEAVYLSIFHSISAFCNAGFSTFSDSFTSFQENVPINLAVCFLIISGGIGFLVLSEIRHRLSVKHRPLSRLSLHSKLVLSSTAILLFVSTVLIVLMEWDNTLTPFHPLQRCLVGFFHAVSARTAGFNSISISDMSNEALFLIILLMIIGASPGSCGGGIKTTTFSCLIILGISRLFGHEKPQLFHRTISQESIGKAVSIVMISIFVIFSATMLMLMTELGEVSHPMSRGKFLELLFEVVSAFGTVGLSTGVTSGLSTAGKLIIAGVMFVGRLGPLMIALAVSRQGMQRHYFAEENIMIG